MMALPAQSSHAMLYALSYSESLSPYISNTIHNGPRTLTDCFALTRSHGVA